MTDKKPQGGMRFNSGKLRFDLLPLDATIELARVHTIGAIKYDDNNWLKGMSWKSMIGCADRHWTLWQCGLARDPDTGCHHLAQVAWNVLGLLVYELRGLGTDDRTKLPIDENFNWIAGPAKELNLGLPPEKLEEIRAKYTKMREEHAAKMAAAEAEEIKKAAMAETKAVGAKTLQVIRDIEKLAKQAPISEAVKAATDLTVVMEGRLGQMGGQDTEGHMTDCFVENPYIVGQGQTEEHTFRKGDTLIVFDKNGDVIFREELKARRLAPSKDLRPDWFVLGYQARLVRQCAPFDGWFAERWIRRTHGKALYCMKDDERTAALAKFTEAALKYAADLKLPVDTKAVEVQLEQAQKTGYCGNG